MNRVHRKTSKLRWLFKLVFIAVGAIFMGIALELFLVPYDVIDGGIAGVSIIFSKPSPARGLFVSAQSSLFSARV